MLMLLKKNGVQFTFRKQQKADIVNMQWALQSWFIHVRELRFSNCYTEVIFRDMVQSEQEIKCNGKLTVDRSISTRLMSYIFTDPSPF